MHERDLWWKISIVGGLVALAFVSVYPLEQKIKYGIDLYGGYSLLYEIDDTGLEGIDRLKLSENVMKVLRKRVDPEGVFNLVWRPVGHNRLEIQMPRPAEGVRDNRAKYETLQEQIRRSVLHRSDILRAAARSGAERERALADLVRGVDSRTPLLEAAAQGYDEHAAMKAAYEARAKQIEADNLSRADIMTAVQAGLVERPAALAALVRGIPARQALLEAAAAAWDEHQAALTGEAPAPPAGETPTLPGETPVLPDAEEKQQALDAAVAAVLEANVDPRKLAEGATKDEVIRLDEVLDQRIADLLATNLDLGRLQALLDAKPNDAFRGEELAKLETSYPGLIGTIRGLLDVSDLLRRTRKGEGRLEDPADLQRLLKGAGVLEFRILPEAAGDPTQFDRYREELAARGPRPKPGEQQYQWFQLEDPVDFLKHFMKVQKKEELDRRFDEVKKQASVVVDRFGDKYYVLSHVGDNYSLTHRASQEWRLKGARFTRDQNGRPAIGFSLDERGGSRFAVLTRTNKGRQLAIFLDDQAISYATIRSAIRTDGIIEGSFTPEEVNEMVKKLNAGSLPQKLKDPPISVRAIGPSLGEANREAGLRSAKWGAVAVLVFLIGYYFYAGSVAVVAVALNMLFIGAAMALMGATLTLPGIAGFVLALGMAVDANVLINERIREELAKGTAMRTAIRLGYERAFSAILDSNLTTIITSAILYLLGSEEIRGFGLTLGIGVLANLFTAYYVTRFFFEIMSAVSVSREVTMNLVYTALATLASGGALYGLGYWWNPEVMRPHSVLMHFGESIAFFAPAILGLYVLMWIVRMIHRSFQAGGASRLPMMRVLSPPSVNWIRLRRYFLPTAVILGVGAIALFGRMDARTIYDIEFLGGTAAQIDLKRGCPIAQLAKTTDRQTAILDKLQESAAKLRQYGREMAQATATSPAANVFVVNTPGVSADRLEPVVKAVMENELSVEVRNPVDFDDPGAETITVQVRSEAKLDLDGMTARVTMGFADRFGEAAEAIASAQVQAVQAMGTGEREGVSFEVVTREPSKDIVVRAIMETMAEDIDVKPALRFKLLPNPAAGGKPSFAIRNEDVRSLGVPLSDADAREVDLQGWQSGVAMVLDQIDPAQDLGELEARLRAMRLQPGFEAYGWRQSKVFGLTPSGETPRTDGRYDRVMVVVADENYPLTDQEGSYELWDQYLAEKEVTLLQEALQRQTSLSQITQFDRQVSDEAKMDAYIALFLSWIAIIIYVWFRFGNARWGFAAVVPLLFDVAIALGCLAASHYVAETVFGRGLLIEKFRIDLSVVAGLLTVVGYSVNDKIVVFDRIRENRGRMSDITPKMVNDSINQILPRTILTGTTSLATILIMYIIGGAGIHAFTYALFIGIVVGTFSSFGIGAQLLVRRAALATAGRPALAPAPAGGRR